MNDRPAEHVIVTAALEYARARTAVGVEVVADPKVRWTDWGSAVVHCQYHYRGVPIFLKAMAVRIGADGRPRTLVGDKVPTAPEVDIVPARGAAWAVDAAAAHVLDGRPAACCSERHASGRRRRTRHRPTGNFPLPSRPTVCNRGGFAEPVTVHLSLYADRLVWVVRALTRERRELCVLVAADRGGPAELLLCEPLHTCACSGSIFLFNPTEAARALVELPRPLSDYPLALQPRGAGLRRDWIATDGTAGNNAETFLDNAPRTIRATGAGGQLVFAPVTPDTADGQCLLNAFYFGNFLHDFFAMLGFDESAGNFQRVNHTVTNGDGDQLKIKVSRQPFDDVGQMRARRDGMTAEMFLGVHPVTQLAGALDGDILIHEFAHGVTLRLIGGLRNSEALLLRQGRAMGEGWSDFFAITIQNFYRQRAGQQPRFTFAAYSSSGTLRTHSYDGHPGSFGNIGQPPLTTIHAAGEVWAATLIDLTGRLVAARGVEAGYALGWQIVFASLSQMPANPTFLDGRAAIFAAISSLQLGDDVADAAREVFRRRGMGRLALGGTPNSFAGIRGDTTA